MREVDNSAAKRAIVIAGPTASGKSALALGLAERYGGVVINADSMQVYADLAVLTARPTAADMMRAPHRLFGHVDAAEAYSVGRWLADLRVALAEIGKTGRVPVIVGGTGLYLKALIEGLSDLPTIPAELRARLRREAGERAPEELHARLSAIDPAMAARLRPSDPQRILRALEVFEATGRSLAAFQGQRGPAILSSSTFAGVFLDVPRALLNARIDQRFDAMMARGALGEVAALARRTLDPALPAMRALGVPHLLEALQHPDKLKPAIATAKTAIQHYAKRQVTYARHQLPDLAWVAPTEATAEVERQLAAMQS